MIERIVIENFKSFRHVDLPLGRMNLLVGLNASGKSNFIEALRTAQGLVNGLTVNEVLNGERSNSFGQPLGHVRGGSEYASFDQNKDIRIYLQVASASQPSIKNDFDIRFSSQTLQVTSDELDGKEGTKFLDPMPAGLEHDRSRSSIGYLCSTANKIKNAPPSHSYDKFIPLYDSVGDMQKIDPRPEILRAYSQNKKAKRMGDNGEHFATVVKTICENHETKEDILAWLKELRPEEIDEVGTVTGAIGEFMFMLKEGDRAFPAPVLSEGTLRFAAVVAAFFQPDMPRLLAIEELESGVHASRVRLLLELIRSQSARTNTQVVATTHSPALLDWLREDEYETTFLCTRDPKTGESKILPFTEVPHLLEVLKQGSLSSLISEGWLETVS